MLGLKKILCAIMIVVVRGNKPVSVISEVRLDFLNYISQNV